MAVLLQVKSNQRKTVEELGCLYKRTVYESSSLG
jgi:hypothetical protein